MIRSHFGLSVTVQVLKPACLALHLSCRGFLLRLGVPMCTAVLPSFVGCWQTLEFLLLEKWAMGYLAMLSLQPRSVLRPALSWIFRDLHAEALAQPSDQPL